MNSELLIFLLMAAFLLVVAVAIVWPIRRFHKSASAGAVHYNDTEISNWNESAGYPDSGLGYGGV